LRTDKKNYFPPARAKPIKKEKTKFTGSLPGANIHLLAGVPVRTRHNYLENSEEYPSKKGWDIGVPLRKDMEQGERIVLDDSCRNGAGGVVKGHNCFIGGSCPGEGSICKELIVRGGGDDIVTSYT